MLDEIFAPNYVNESAAPGVPPDRTGTRAFVSAFRNAFPDVRIIVHDMITEGNKVVQRWTIQGTHLAAFMGIPPSGKTISINGIDIFLLTDGMVTSHWDAFDNLSMPRQLGAVP